MPLSISPGYGRLTLPGSAPPGRIQLGGPISSGGSRPVSGSSGSNDWPSELRSATDEAVRVSEANRASFDSDVNQALQAALRAAGMIDDYTIGQTTELMQEIFGAPDMARTIFGDAQESAAGVTSLVNNYVNNVLPELASTSRAMLEQAAQTVSEYMSGELPQDVQDNIIRNVAERFPNLGADRFQNLAARHLGVTSLELSQMGLANAGNVTAMAANIGGMYGNAANMAAIPVAVQSTLGQLGNTLAAPYMQRLSDPTRLTDGFFSQLSSNRLDPNTVFQGGVSLAGAGMELSARESWFQREAMENRRITDMNYEVGLEAIRRAEDQVRDLMASTRNLNSTISGTSMPGPSVTPIG